MRILISGSRGMIGSAVTPYLAEHGHDVVRLVRREPGAGELPWDPDSGSIDQEGLEGFDGVVHLATMPWPARWTAVAKERIKANRLATNSLLADSLARCTRKPKVLICSSGMGIYPSSGDSPISEESAPGTDFLALLQRDGEAATRSASAAGIRVVNLRTPGVIGGAMVLRNVGRLGTGRQWSSWVARDELARIIEFVLRTDSLTGPLNPCSPHAVRNSDFAATLSRVLGARPGMPVPAWVLKIMMGEMAEALILASRRMEPCKLLQAGYQFLYPELEAALGHEVEAARRIED